MEPRWNWCDSAYLRGMMPLRVVGFASSSATATMAMPAKALPQIMQWCQAPVNLAAATTQIPTLMMTGAMQLMMTPMTMIGIQLMMTPITMTMMEAGAGGTMVVVEIVQVMEGVPVALQIRKGGAAPGTVPAPVPVPVLLQGGQRQELQKGAKC